MITVLYLNGFASTHIDLKCTATTAISFYRTACETEVHSIACTFDGEFVGGCD